MNAVKWELEDLSFATLYPKMYEEIVRLVGQRAPSRDQYLATVIDQIEADLKTAKVKAVVTGRPKHYYSVYQKMIVRGRDFADIYDLVGRPHPGRERPRLLRGPRRRALASGARCRGGSRTSSPCRSSTCTSRCTRRSSAPTGKPVELQIRTQDMHRSAEFGVAAHWRYKQQDVAGKAGPG